MLSYISEMIAWARAYSRAFMLCRFSLLSLVAGAAFLFIPQGQEILLLMGYDHRHWASSPSFIAAGILWALGSWYWSRTILSFKFFDWPPTPISEGDPFPGICRNATRAVPRFIGISSLLIISGALCKSIGLQAITLIFFFITGLFFVFVVYRRKIFKKFFARDTSWAFSDNTGQASLRSMYSSQPWTIYLLLLSLIFTSVLFFLFTFRYTNIYLSPKFGAASILLFAAASWVPAGSALIYVSQRYRFPALTMVVIYLIAISGCTDNHSIATIASDDATGQAMPHSPNSIREDFQNWLAKRKTTDGSPVPVFLVAAEGGGIRAAYWTASVLGKLQELNPKFSSHTYVISGVSGGSLGAAVFDALAVSGAKHQYVHCAQQVLSQDFLAPTIASMLYPEVVQRFIFVPISYFDRSRTLEAAWANAWNAASDQSQTNSCSQNLSKGLLGKSFDALWLNDEQRRIPSLILNSTQVETGHRVLMSNLPIISDEFTDVTNLRKKWAEKEARKYPINMALSTAVHGSARFTYVSPAGKIDKDFHIVDGGYFENSGTTSLAEVLRVLEDHKKEIQPIIIHISNDVTLERIYSPVFASRDNALKLEESAASGLPFGKETLPPIVTLLNTRDARGIYATGTIAREVTSNYCNGRFAHFGLHNKELPLGWSLSLRAEELIQEELNSPETKNTMSLLLKELERSSSSEGC